MKRVSPLKAVAILLFLTFFGISAALVLIEVAFRLFAPAKPIAWNDRPHSYFVPENAATLQDYSYALTKPDGVYRIAVVGDSFTFAPYMQFDDAFPKRLERWLNLNTQQQKVEVINYGVPRYSTSHEVRITEKAIEQGADLVLLQITLNDPEIKPFWPTGLDLDLDTGKVKLTNPVFHYWKSLAYVITRLENTRTHREYKEYFFRLFRKKDTWHNFSSSIEKIADLGKSRQTPIVAVVFPLFGYVVDDNYPFFPIHQQVTDLLKKVELPHLDITEEYRDIPLDRMQVMPVVDRHPNEIAHRMAAERILGWLTERRLLPEEIVPRRTARLRVGLQDVPEPAPK